MRNSGKSSILTTLLILALAPAAAPAAEPVLEGEIFTEDQAHSLLDFTVRQVGFGRVRGTFNRYDAAIYYVEEDLTKSSVSVLIHVDSLDTGTDARDEDLRGEDFFHVERFPTIEFRSQRVERTPAGFALVGPLTIRDVTRTIRIPFEVISRKAVDQFHNQRIAFEANLTLDRKTFGVVGPTFWNNLISDEVKIDISLAGRIFNFNNPFGKWKENSIGKVLEETVEAEGIDLAREKALDLWENHRDEYDFRLSQFYRAGMKLAQRGQLKAALAIFDLAAQLYEETAEAADLSVLYATMGETHARAGDRRQAIVDVKKALALEPTNLKARELLRHLKN